MTEPTEPTAPQNEPVTEPTASPVKTFSQDELNRIVEERLERERKKYADYKDLKAAKTRLDELEKAKLSDEEKAAARLKELNDKIAEGEKALKDKSLKELLRDKIEQAIADGKMKLPKGKTIASLVAKTKASEEDQIDTEVEDWISFFPPDEPSKGIGGGSQQPAAKAPDLKDQIAALTAQASDPSITAAQRTALQTQILGLKLGTKG